MDFSCIFLPFLSLLPPFLSHVCCTELCIVYMCVASGKREKKVGGEVGARGLKRGAAFASKEKGGGETLGARWES